MVDSNKEKLKTSINPIWLAIPATFDLCASSLLFFALTQCASSVYEMMRGSIVLITATMAVTFLKEKRYCHHWSALVFIVSGVAIVGFVGVTSSKKKEEATANETPTSLLGIIMILISQCF